MISDLLETPLPFLLVFVIYAVFSLPKISTKWWAKIGRLSAIIIFLFNLWSLYDVGNRKDIAVQHRMHAQIVVEFTAKMEKLIDAGKCEETKKSINQFNKKYISVYSLEKVDETVTNALDEWKID